MLICMIVLKGQCLSLVCSAQLLRPASVLGLYVDVLSFSQQTCTSTTYQVRKGGSAANQDLAQGCVALFGRD